MSSFWEGVLTGVFFTVVPIAIWLVYTVAIITADDSGPLRPSDPAPQPSIGESSARIISIQDGKPAVEDELARIRRSEGADFPPEAA